VFFYVLAITWIAGVLGTGMGGVLGVLFSKNSDKITGLLVSFAAGIMLSVVCFNMIEEAVLPEQAGQPMSVWLVNMGIAVGFLLVWWLHDWIGGLRSDFGNQNLLTAGIVMVLAIAIHNLPEGMVIGASCAADSMGTAGLLMAFVIGIHNIPEGMAVSVALAGGGMHPIKTILLTSASGFPTVIGAIIGWKLGIMGPVMLSFMLSFAAGAMLYVVMGELIPEGLHMCSSRIAAVSILVGMLTGLIIIFA
jgi:ZIP family zinc transporter